MEKLKKILSEVLEISADIIDDETSPATVETWDSFNGLMLVSELEKEYDIKFTMDEVLAVKNVKDIKDSLKKHGVTLEE